MASILDLTAQGDVGTLADESQLSKITLMTPQQLYEMWERQAWQAYAIDLSRDRTEWTSLSDADRAEITWPMSQFYLGEERVTTQFSGLVMAYEDQSEEAFLTTQQVDEARHTQFFARYFRDVLGRTGTMEAELERAREDANEAYYQIFDVHLADACQRLVENPSDRAAKVDFLAVYHMIIEGTLALTGQFFIADYLEKRGLLPGFVEGFRNISQDEHRHVAYGTWYLKKACQKEPALMARLQDKLGELLPLVPPAIVPPGQDPAGEWELLGYRGSEVVEFAFRAVSRRLKVIGAGLPEVATA